MFLVIAISTIILTTTSIFQFSTVGAQSNDNSGFVVDTTVVEPTTVTVKNFEFDRPSLSVPNGTKVIFDFQDPFHTVKTTSASMAEPITINNGEGERDAVPQGEKREVIINGSSGGMIEYECGIHGQGMIGIIRIEEGNIGGGSEMLLITLEDWGGIFPNQVDRVYNSYSGKFTVASNDIERISIDTSDSQIQDLKSNITGNNFFGLNNEYGHPSDCCDIIHHTLSISMGNNGGQDSKTVYWNDAADFPGNLTKIASLIRSLH